MKRFFLSFTLFALTFVLLLCSNVQALQAYASNALDLSSKSAFLMEYDSGQTLFAKDENKRLPVASMVKMMTILIALEELDAGNVALDTKITTTENASSMGGSQVFIDPFVEYSFEDLLKSVIMASANDASVALAEYFNGNEKAFTNRMNKRAAALGMKNTHYANCTGLPAPEQYSTAKDTAILLKEILKHEIYHKYSTIWMDKLVHPSGRETELVNTNRLVRYYQGCDSGKTGSTNEAGCCLGASAKRGDMRLISVVVGADNSKTRFNESALLFNYGFGNFESKRIVDCDQSFGEISVSKGKKESVKVYPKESFTAVVKKGEKTGYETNVDMKKSVCAPRKKGEEIGHVTVSKDGKVLKKISIVSGDDAKALSWFETAHKIMEKW